jgi:hypothetical protein
MDNTPDFTILLGGLWAQEVDVYAVCGDDGVEFGVVDLTIIVTLYRRKRQIKVSIGEHAKRGERDVSIRFWRRERSTENK